MTIDVGEQLIAYRKANNLTQEQVAEQLEVTQQTVANWEAGTTPRPHALDGLRAMLSRGGPIDLVQPQTVSTEPTTTRSAIQVAFLSKANELVSAGKLSDTMCVELLASWKDLF